jgi:hypothetical protein
MKRYLMCLVMLALLVMPCLAAFPWCADQDIFFYNASSDITGYRKMDHVPELDSQRSITTPSFNSASGEIVVGTWATPIGSPGVTSIAPGLWRFRNYASSSSSSGVTTLKFYIINRSASGTETALFFGNAITRDIDATGVPAEYLTSYARRNTTTMFPGDRMVIRVNASTTSSSARTLIYELAGNTNASMVSVSYFLCSDTDASSSSSVIYRSGGNGTRLPMHPAIPIVSVLMVVAYAVYRTKK